MSMERKLLDDLDEARAQVETYNRRVWWLGFTIVVSIVLIGAGFALSAMTGWPNIPVLVGLLGLFGLLGSVSGLTAYVFNVGTDRVDYLSRAKTSPQSQLRKAERAYRDHMVSG